MFSILHFTTGKKINLAATGFYRCRQLTKQRIGIFPANTGVSNAFTVGQRLTAFQTLVSFYQMTLDHHANNRFFTARYLLTDIGANLHLLLKLLTGVGMAEIDHDLRRQSRFDEAFFHLSNMLRAIVWRFTAAQNDMAVAVAAGIHNRRMTPFSDGEEAMRRAGGVNGVNNDVNTKTDGTTQ